MGSASNGFLALLAQARAEERLEHDLVVVELTAGAIALFDQWRAGSVTEEQRKRAESSPAHPEDRLLALASGTGLGLSTKEIRAIAALFDPKQAADFEPVMTRYRTYERLAAGTAAVLATRWKVPEDIRTSRFLLDFYREYRQGGENGKGLRKDQALTIARRLSRKRGDPAQVWAAWVLIGDAR